MLSEEEKKILKIFKAQVEKEETEYFSVNAYTQLLYDSHKTVLNLITKLQKENEEKDKQIDFMANAFSLVTMDIPHVKEQFKKLYCEFINSDEDCCWKTDKDCQDCMKQYFERLAKEKGE